MTYFLPAHEMCLIFAKTCGNHLRWIVASISSKRACEPNIQNTKALMISCLILLVVNTVTVHRLTRDNKLTETISTAFSACFTAADSYVKTIPGLKLTDFQMTATYSKMTSGVT